MKCENVSSNLAERHKMAALSVGEFHPRELNTDLQLRPPPLLPTCVIYVVLTNNA
jgi:hypothetical protein